MAEGIPTNPAGKRLQAQSPLKKRQRRKEAGRRIRRPPLQRSANRKRVQIGSGPPRRHRKKSLAVSAGKIWERRARRRSSRRPRLSSGRKAQSLPKPQKHRAGSPEWNPQRIAERNRICPPNLRNRPARSSKRLRLSLRRKTQVPFQTENAWEPGAERPENPDGGESQEPVAERPSAQPYDQSPGVFQAGSPDASACVESRLAGALPSGAAELSLWARPISGRLASPAAAGPAALLWRDALSGA